MQLSLAAKWLSSKNMPRNQFFAAFYFLIHISRVFVLTTDFILYLILYLTTLLLTFLKSNLTEKISQYLFI